jgi:hypothetical protein
MGILSDFEDRLARTVEGAFAGAFRSPVQPAELARALSRAMDDGRVVGVGKVWGPTEYVVELSQDDAYKLQSFEGVLSKELATYLQDHARKRDYTLACAPTVEFEMSTALKLGRFRITAGLASPPEPAAAAPASFPEAAPQVAPAVRKPVVVPTPAAAPGPLVTPGSPVAADLPVVPFAITPGHSALPAAAPGPLVRPESPAPAPVPMVAPIAGPTRLATVTIGDDPHDIALRGDRMEIGRLAGCALRIDDANASRRHAAIVADSAGWSVEDLGSTNGTFFNGELVTELTPLSDGDVISVGTTRLVFHAGAR